MENAAAVPTIALERVESSQIHSIGHDPETNTLAIRFLAKRGGDEPGSLYHYANFTAEDFEAFSNAESIGSHFGKHIKVFDKKYPYRKVDESASAAT
ncbi:KTSC domain-containing protein [Paraburkholderia sacchari]|uniref:KTSC domain-containing protein n=1 Tax=Paraburkholderia sacchari TaxID=159450 RepID=UPI001BD10B77|nr:KTSC domain-containing protein [Paraburkholderia sacchari]